MIVSTNESSLSSTTPCASTKRHRVKYEELALLPSDAGMLLSSLLRHDSFAPIAKSRGVETG